MQLTSLLWFWPGSCVSDQYCTDDVNHCNCSLLWFLVFHCLGLFFLLLFSPLPSSGVCCASLEEPKALMKMGLSLVLIGHINFLLGALVHGVVLRHINLHKQARAMEYAISNVFALTSGLVVSAWTYKIHTGPAAFLQNQEGFGDISGNIMECNRILKLVLHISSMRFRKMTKKNKPYRKNILFRLCNVTLWDFPSGLWLHPANHKLQKHLLPQKMCLELIIKYCRTFLGKKINITTNVFLGLCHKISF